VDLTARRQDGSLEFVITERKTMTYRGHIENGAVVVDEPINLPEGTAVRVEPVAPAGERTLAERFEAVIGTVTDLPEDMADNHDFYIHGHLTR
jgi:hypothetical protein